MVHAGDCGERVGQIAAHYAGVVLGHEGRHQGVLLAGHHGAQRLFQAGHARRLAWAFAVAGLDRVGTAKEKCPPLTCATWVRNGSSARNVRWPLALACSVRNGALAGEAGTMNGCTASTTYRITPLAIRRHVASASGFLRSKMLGAAMLQSMQSAAVRHGFMPAGTLPALSGCVCVGVGHADRTWACFLAVNAAGQAPPPIDYIPVPSHARGFDNNAGLHADLDFAMPESGGW